MRPWAPVALSGLGFALLGSAVIRETLARFQEVPPSVVVLGFLAPLMLAGQVILAEARRRVR